MNSKITAKIHLIIDKILRARNKARRLLFVKGDTKATAHLSDSESSFYIQSLLDINNSPDASRFRKNFDYREILEHVDYELGLKYLERIEDLGFNLSEILQLGLQNDVYGSPRTYKYRNLPRISPTTLRYLSVACELKKLFGSLEHKKIIEIGAGYGGQFAILSRMFDFESYSIYDLPEAQALTNRFLNAVGATVKPTMLDIRNVQPTGSDLVISNYAFSELPRGIQKEYLEKTLSKSNCGYLIMNSGKRNITGRSYGKLSVDELRMQLGNSNILPEVPLTGPDNYVLTWS